MKKITIVEKQVQLIETMTRGLEEIINNMRTITEQLEQLQQEIEQLYRLNMETIEIMENLIKTLQDTAQNLLTVGLEETWNKTRLIEEEEEGEEIE